MAQKVNWIIENRDYYKKELRKRKMKKLIDNMAIILGVSIIMITTYFALLQILILITKI